MNLVTRIISVLLLCTAAINVANAQNGKMTLPSNPAFSILNLEPSAVMKPTSNKDLGADILNSFDKNGKLLMNIGLEVSPYWLKNRPFLRREEYLNPTVIQCFKQSFNFSAATVRDSVNGYDKLGTGFRFKLVNGKPVDDYIQAERRLTERLNISNVVLGCIALVEVEEISSIDSAILFITTTMDKEMGYGKDTVARVRQAALAKARGFEDTKVGIKNFLLAFNEELINNNMTFVNKVAELSKKRTGLIIEVAGASSFVVSKGSESLSRAGIWINTSDYFSPTDAWTVTMRYMFANKDSAITNADIGLSYLKEGTNFNLSIEGMVRWYSVEFPDFNLSNQPITRVEKDFTYRVSVQGSYKLAENISVNMSMGKDFNSPFISNNGFFSIFGVNYSLFKPAKVNLN